MIALEGVWKAYGSQAVLEDCSWLIGRRDRVGLVGPNGSGKSTLCRILAGLEEADAGRVHRERGVRVGYLPQEVGAGRPGTVLAEALSGFDQVWQLEAELERLAARLAADPDPACTAAYGEAQLRFDALGGYRLEAAAKAILGGLGFGPEALHRPLHELSGGWRMRAALARLLLLRPELLLLDEPTNHLDLPSLAWLEDFLAAWEGSVVMVSHDRYFLNRMVTTVAAVEGRRVARYRGGWDDYVVEREARRALGEARARSQARRVAEVERFIQRFRAKATKARQVQSRIKMLARLEGLEVAARGPRVRFEFPQPPRAGRVVAALRGVHKAYGERVVYAGADLAVERGERVALVGPNGAGKSTLLRILAGVLPFERGERTLGAHADVHYYAQHQLEALDPGRTVLEEMARAAPAAPLVLLRGILGRFLLGGEAADKRVAVLSGGEKARLALARLLVRPAALLCLDEPTNHLDLDSREVLEEALVGFGGTIVFISHDRYFINRVATRVVEVEAGRLESHLGGYDDYLRRKAAAPPPHAVSAAPDRAASRPAPATRGRSPERRALERQVRDLQARLEAVERQIHEGEGRLAEMGRALADPALYRDGERARQVAQARRETEEQLARLMKEWEALSLALTALAGRT